MIVQHQEKLSSVELVNSLRVLNYLSFKLFSRAALPPTVRVDLLTLI
jgi:hypothetical protein